MIKRVLFVDDETRILDMFRRILRDQSQVWDMSFATSVDEALDLMVGADFDAIVSDINMPGKDGFEFLRVLRSQPETVNIPVIILTGNTEKNLKRIALDSGATDLLDKPVEQEDLISRIRSVLRLKEYQDEIKSQNENLERRVKERTSELERSRLEVILRLAKAGEYRDTDTGDHVLRVGWYCRLIAETIGASAEFVSLLSLTSPLHDIGKIGISDAVLLKPGRLTPEERRVMEQHCQIGGRILQEQPQAYSLFGDLGVLRAELGPERPPNRFLEMASSIAMNHHERWDGKGYPRGIAGEQIPLDSRITALADVYDALRSVRPYKVAFSHEEAMKIIQGEDGHFDPSLLKVFGEVAGKCQKIFDAVEGPTVEIEAGV